MVLGLEYQILLALVTHGKELLFENRFSLFWYYAEVSVKNTGAGVKLLTCPYPLKIQACPLLDSVERNIIDIPLIIVVNKRPTFCNLSNYSSMKRLFRNEGCIYQHQVKNNNPRETSMHCSPSSNKLDH